VAIITNITNVYWHYKLGIELAMIKVLFYVKKCDACKNLNVDVKICFDILVCKDCKKVTGQNVLMEFNNFILKEYNYRKKHVSNVIDVARVCTAQSEFIKLSANFESVKKYKSIIKKNKVMVAEVLANIV